jgi:citrate lyase beta subunit
MSYLQLGASLYVPATRTDLVDIANCHRYPELRSVIFCTEDAVAAPHVPQAVANLQHMLDQLAPVGMKRFIRVRNPEVLKTLMATDGIHRLDGFVLPKVTQYNFRDYASAIPDEASLLLMPTLETKEVFDPSEMRALLDLLRADPVRSRIICLRIGGNDLLHLLALRRSRGGTIYETPLGATISQLVTIFRPEGFSLTAPVFDRLDDQAALMREVRMDVDFGLLGKTAIHPSQISSIESQYKVAENDWEIARRILHENALPVFRYADTMCEPATHRPWADLVVARARIYGLEKSCQSGQHEISLDADLNPCS